MKRAILVVLAIALMAPCAARSAAPAPEKSDTFSLCAEDVELRKIFQMIARRASLNILIDKSVRGKIPVELRDVPCLMALRAVAFANRYVVVPYQEGKVTIYMIVPPDVAELIPHRASAKRRRRRIAVTRGDGCPPGGAQECHTIIIKKAGDGQPGGKHVVREIRKRRIETPARRRRRPAPPKRRGAPPDEAPEDASGGKGDWAP